MRFIQPEYLLDAKLVSDLIGKVLCAEYFGIVMRVYQNVDMLKTGILEQVQTRFPGQIQICPISERFGQVFWTRPCPWHAGNAGN